MAASTQLVGNAISPLRGPGNSRDANEIRLEGEIERLHALILDGDLGLQLRRHQRGQRG